MRHYRQTLNTVSEKAKAHLLFHHHPSNSSLNHVGPVETVHAVDSEETLLLADDSRLVHPDTGRSIQNPIMSYK